MGNYCSTCFGSGRRDDYDEVGSGIAVTVPMT